MLWNYKSEKNTNRRRNGGYSILKYNLSEKNLLIEALIAYKDDDNEEYNFEINQLIEKLKND